MRLCLPPPISVQLAPLVLLVLLVAPDVTLRAAAPPVYTAIELGAFTPGRLSWAEDVNNRGMVVGRSEHGPAPRPPVPVKAFYWTVANGMVELGTLGGSQSAAHAVNNHDMIVGDSFLGSPGGIHAFAWTKVGGMVDLGTFGGWSSATAVADTGWVAGWSEIDLVSPRTRHAFVWTATDGMVDLGTLGGKNSSASGVNDNGMVVGRSEFEQGNADSHAFVWTAAEGMVDLGTLGGSASEATAVNDNGVVVGWSTMEGSTARHAFVWTASGGMIDLGTLGGSRSSATCVNDRGYVFGSSSVEGDIGPDIAFVWTAAGGMVELGIPSVSGANDRGWLVGGTTPFFGAPAALFVPLGSPDLVWQHDTTRQATVWHMGGPEGNELLGSNWLSADAVPGWRIVAAVDFDADGHLDLIWQDDATRQVTVWYMGGEQGDTYLGANWLSTETIPEWRVVAATDFNADGLIDLVWQHDTTHQVTVWYLGGEHGTVFVDARWLNAAAIPEWRVVAAADSNGDGSPDLIWQNDETRQVTVWYLGGPHGDTYLGSAWLNSGAIPEWSVATAADFDLNGHADLVWQHDTTRQVAVWYLGGDDGTLFVYASWLSSEAIPEWSVVGR